jgi:Putative peptidoglycan binding domain
MLRLTSLRARARRATADPVPWPAVVLAVAACLLGWLARSAARGAEELVATSEALAARPDRTGTMVRRTLAAACAVCLLAGLALATHTDRPPDASATAAPAAPTAAPAGRPPSSPTGAAAPAGSARAVSPVARTNGVAAKANPPAGQSGPGPAQPPSRSLAGAAASTLLGPVGHQIVPIRNGAVPVGKGMWIWLPLRSDGGNVTTIVARARAVGLNYLYVRTGSSWDGFVNQAFLDQLLPAAHAASIRVYGWDFPNLASWPADVARAAQAVTYTTPTGDRIDGFAADVETGGEGTRLSPAAALAYGTGLRQAVGWGYPLIAVVPKLSGPDTHYPYPHVVAQFDAIAPMVYWLDREPGEDVAQTIRWLSRFGKPIIPVGQAYDGAVDHGPGGAPNRMAIHRFMGVAEQWGATSVSFWDWQEADQEEWDAIRDAPWFTIPGDGRFRDAQTRSMQSLLRSMGWGGSANGLWDGPTLAALREYQAEAGLAPTGVVDATTRARLLRPFTPPLRPIPH